MSDIPGGYDGGPPRDDISESSGDVELSDPGSSETSSVLAEEVHAEDTVAEEEFRDAQENYSVGDPHAEYHAAEEAYYASRRPQTGSSDHAQSDFASAADVLDDTELEPASEQHTEPTAPAGNGNGNGNGSPGHFEESDLAGDHEQAPAVPALTAETEDDAVLPSIEAVSDSQAAESSAASASQQQQDQQRTEAESEIISSQTAQASEHDSQASDHSTDTSEHEANVSEHSHDEIIQESAPLSRLPSLPAYAEPGAEDVNEQEQPAVELVVDQQSTSQSDEPERREVASQSDESESQQEAVQSDESEGQQEAVQSKEPAPRARLPSLPSYASSASEHQEAQEEEQQPAQAAEPAEASPEVQRLIQQAFSQAAGSSKPSSDAPAHARQSQQEATVSTSAEDVPAAADAPSQATHSQQATVSPSEARPAAASALAHATQSQEATVSTFAEDSPAAIVPSMEANRPAASSASTSDTNSARQPSGVTKPSLPARRGPALPARHSAGSSAAPAASSQQQAVPPRPAPSGNVTANAPAAPTPSSAVANNGHSQSNTRSSATTAGNGAPQQQAPAPAAAPAVAAANANPRIPPRQPAGNGQAGPPAAAPADGENDEHRDLREKVQNFRVMLVRLALRLQHTMRSSIVQQVNYRLDLAERIRLSGNSGGRLASSQFGFDAACNTAQNLEETSPDESLAFTCTVMVIGMSGVGKSATINSLLQKDSAAPTNAYKLGTTSVREVVGDICGVKVRFIDTPGLQPGAGLTGKNARLLNQMHSAFKKYKPDIMLYMDRADVFRTDQADVPLLRAITESFGPSTWFNTIVALTHAAAAPPDGNAGPISYETYTRTRTQLLQQNIRHASNDQRLLNPVALVENHPNCRTNDRGQAILPNQHPWKEHLTLLLLSSKLLADTDALLKIQQDSSAHEQQRRAMRMLLSGRKMPPIPYLIAGFIQKKSPRKPPDEERQFRHDAELKDLSTMDRKEEMRRRREYSRMRADEAKAEAGATQAGVPAPDIPLQPTFDGDDTTHRYRYMEPGPDAALCRPVVDPNGLDHDDGMTAFTVEKNSVIRKRGVYVGGAPAYVMAQVHKDKDAFTVISEAEASYYHTHKMISTASLESQTVQADALFTTKLETRYKMHPKNKTAAGILLSRLKEDGGLPTKGPVVYGGKLEDRYKASDKLKVVLATATLMNKPEQNIRKEQAWNHSAEVRYKGGEDDKCLVSLSGNNMRFHGKSGYGGGASVQYAHSKDTTGAASMQLNSERTGKLSMRVTSHEYPKMGFSLLVPVVGMLWGKIRGQD